MLFYTILASKIGILTKIFEYHLYFSGALGAATTSGIGLPTMHFLIRFVIMQLPNMYPNRALAKYASQTCTCQIYLQLCICQICIPNGDCQIYLQIVHLPNMHHQRAFAKYISNYASAKYASQMVFAKYIFILHICYKSIPTVLAKYIFQLCVCQICIPNDACQIYLHIAHLLNVHPKGALAKYISNYAFAALAR